MSPEILPALQDTTVMALARDGLTTFAAWATGGILLVFAVLTVVVMRVLAEVRRLSAAWTDFLVTANARSESLVASATSAARNIDRISSTVSEEADRLRTSFGSLAGGIEHASGHLQNRLKDLLALVDLAHSEAEDAVLEAASNVRAFRANATGFLLSQLRRSTRVQPLGDDAAPGRDGVSEIEGSAEASSVPVVEKPAPHGGTPIREEGTAPPGRRMPSLPDGTTQK